VLVYAGPIPTVSYTPVTDTQQRRVYERACGRRNGRYQSEAYHTDRRPTRRYQEQRGGY
jgi:hypothetical protein